MEGRPGVALAALLLAGGLPVFPAEAATVTRCEDVISSFDYTVTAATAAFTLRPRCGGSAAQVGSTSVHLAAQRCDVLGCSTQPPHTVLCRWTPAGCRYTLRWPHEAVERARYEFGITYVNDRTKRVVFAGGHWRAASCLSAAVTYDCTPG